MNANATAAEPTEEFRVLYARLQAGEEFDADDEPLVFGLLPCGLGGCADGLEFYAATAMEMRDVRRAWAFLHGPWNRA